MPRLNRARGISAIAFAIRQMYPMRWRRSGRNPWWNCAHYLRRHLTVLKLPRAGVARSSHSALRAETLPSIHKRISPGAWPVATPPARENATRSRAFPRVPSPESRVPHQLCKPMKEVTDVVGARRRFRVSLETERGAVGQCETLQRTVE